MGFRRWFALKAIAWLTAERPSSPLLASLADHEALMRAVLPGDVVLMEGMTRVGAMIKTIGQSTWSHAALCVGGGDELSGPGWDDFLKVHAGLSPQGPVLLEVLLGQGAVLKPLRAYQGTHLRLCRPRGLAPADRAAIVRYALARIGYGYDLRQLLDLARLALPWHFVPWRFRSSLFARRAGPHTRTVCSALIAEAFQSVGFPILPMLVSRGDTTKWYRCDSRFSLPKDFDISPFFDIVKVTPSTYRHYRSVVWETEDAPPSSAASVTHRDPVVPDRGKGERGRPLPKARASRER